MLFPAARPVTSPALAFLPADTRLVVVASSLDQLLPAMGWDEAKRLQPKAFEQLGRMLEGSMGHNLLDPAELGRLGLATDQPWGMALLDRDTVALFGGLSSAQTFQAEVTRLAPLLNQAIAAEPLGRAMLLRSTRPDSWRILIREGHAVLVLASSDEQAQTVARRMVELPAAQSLARSQTFAASMRKLDFGVDVAGYTTTDLLPENLAREIGMGERAMPFVFGLDIEPNEIRARALAALAEDAPLRSILQGSSQTPVLFRVLSARKPNLIFDATIDTSALLRLPLASELDDALRDLVGLSLVQDLAPLLDGELGFAMTLVENRKDEQLEPASVLVHALAELTDASKARVLLDRIMRHERFAALLRPGSAPGRYVLAFGTKDLHVGIAGRYLYVSTEQAMARELASTPQEPGNANALHLAAALGKSVLAEVLLGRGEVGLRASMDAVLPSYWYLMVRSAYGMPLPPEPEGMSEEYRRKREELLAAMDELERLEQRALWQSNLRALELMDNVGAWALRATITEDGLVLHGGHAFGKGGLPGLLAEILPRMAGIDIAEPPSPDVEARNLAMERVRTLSGELEQLQQQAQQPEPGGDQEQISGALSSEAVQAVIARNRPKFRACYQRALLSDPRLQRARIAVSFVIDAAGLVKDVSTTGEPAALGECIAGVARSLRFPRTKRGSETRVIYPFTFDSTPEPSTPAPRPGPGTRP